MKQWTVVAMLSAMTTTTGTHAERPSAAEEAMRLPPVVVEAERESEKTLPAVEGAKIYQGKKTTVTELEEVPSVINNNYRQAFTQTPGLLVSEQNTPGHTNLNYRGIGDPHESEFVLTLKDGVPIVSDWFGYPTAYYTPPLELIERVEFIRGGSSLLYGPQPGPVLHYVTFLPPRGRPFTARTQHGFGSANLYSSTSSVGGTVEKFGYLVYFHHRQGDGPRDFNSDFLVHAGSLKLVLDATERSRWIFAFDGYSAESGEAGRLTLAEYLADRNQTTRPIDRLFVERYAPSLTFEQNFSPDTLLTVKGWGGYQDRFSRRQNAAGTFTNLDDQEFFFGGVDARVRHDWAAWNNSHTLTSGLVVYGADAPRTRERNAGLSTASSGTPRFELERHTLYGAVFAENAFQFGRFALIPALRLELVRVHAVEIFNAEVTRALIDETFTAVVPLGGVGLAFDLGRGNELYANASRGYRPPKYDDLVNPTSNSQLAPSDLAQGGTWNFELGARGRPAPWLWYDTSLFWTDFDGFIENRDLGGGNFERSNSGRAIFKGWESALEVELLGLRHALCRSEKQQERAHQFSLFANALLLDAEFVEGVRDGNTPAYAPEFLVKTGAIYRWGDRLKASLTGTMVDEHFWQDSNTAGAVGTGKIASYTVWDLAVEVHPWKHFGLFAGINNLFDEDYYSRIRSDGIEPALRRNFYGGFKLVF